MSIDLVNLFGDRAVLPTSGFPFGSIKNRVSESDRGTPLLDLIYNDILGPLHSLLSLAGMSPNGSVDFVGNSQYLRALIEQIIGRASICESSGNSTNLNLSPVDNQEPPESLFDGMTLIFRNSIGANSSTTINAFSLGARPVALSSGGSIVSADIQGLVVIIYNGEIGRWEIPAINANRIVGTINRNVLPGPSSSLAGIVRQATTTEANNRSNVTAFVAPNQLPRQATNAEVADRSNVTAFVAPDQLPTTQEITFFESALLPIANGTLVEAEHNLSSQPMDFNAYYQCTVALDGFVVGEQVKVGIVYFNDSEEVGVSVSADDERVYASISSYGSPRIYSKINPGQTLSVTSANWGLVLKASL